MSHRRRGQCSIGIFLNNDRQAAFINVSNCTTLHTDLMHIAEIVEIAYGMIWKSRRRSWMMKGDKDGL